MTLAFTSDDARAGADNSSRLPGSEAVTLLSRRLLCIVESMNKLRRDQYEEDTIYRSLIKKLGEEEASLQGQLDSIDARCARLTEFLKTAMAPRNATLLWDKMQRLSSKEMGLELLELQVSEKIHSIQQRLACAPCTEDDMENPILKEKPPFCSTWEPSLPEFRERSSTQLTVAIQRPANTHNLGKGDTLCPDGFLNAVLHKISTPSPELKHFMLILSEPDCDPQKVGKLLDCFAATSPHVLLQVDERGNTPLHAACGAAKFSLPLVKMLLRAGAEICSRNIAGLTPFHVACLNISDCDAVLKKCLLRAGCDINERAADGTTAAHLCATDDIYFYSFRFLYHAGADMSAGAFFQGMWCTPPEVARASGLKASRISALVGPR